MPDRESRTLSYRRNLSLATGIVLACIHLSAGAAASSAGAAGESGAAPESSFAVAGEVWTSPAFPSGAATPRDDNTLAGIYGLALRNDPVLAVAEASYRVGQEQKRIGLAGLLPQVNGSYAIDSVEQEARGGFAIGPQVISSDTDSEIEQDQWSINLEQPVFDLPAWFSFRQGSELSEQAAATFSQAQQDLIVRVINAYTQVQRAGANLEASGAQVEAFDGQLEQVRQRFDVGLVAITDVLDAEAAYDNAIADQIADSAALDVALEQLSVITGQQHAEVWKLRDEFPVDDPTPDAMDDWVAFALEHNVDLTVAELGRDATLQAARAAAAQHLPRVTLGLSRRSSDSEIDQTDLNTFNRDGSPNPFFGVTTPFTRDQDVDSITLSVTVPVFSGGRISAQRRQAYARLDGSTYDYERTRRAITQQTRAFYINVKRDVARTQARARAIASTQSALEAAQVGYEVGTRNVVDVLNAQRAVFSAIRDHSNSIVDFVQDVVQLKRQAGILTPADVLELDRWLRKPSAPTASVRGVGGARESAAIGE